ncbi:MAG: lysine--tRNA ligase [Deltaproteobacteria bacterium]|nr:lysine--tRNA ligase [Deltaproteobacteria bacterium]
MEENELLRKRREKNAQLGSDGIELYPNEVKVSHTSVQLVDAFSALSGEELALIGDVFSLAGRIMAVRSFGKGAFISLQDRTGRIQALLSQATVGEQTFGLFKRLDVGDIISVVGRLMKTRTGELTLEAKEFRLLSKSIRQLPEKWHGLSDIETRYRQRHLDLIVNEKSRNVFITRSEIIKLMRHFMDDKGFLEVETPMMHPISGGATARPFVTHHNALDMELFLRIAPELYLKRLITGGLERVYEINRNFRNEGISTTHNPEFTMMEFYQAYATFTDLMNMTEEMFAFIATEVLGSPECVYQGATISLKPPWKRVPLRDALAEYAAVPSEVLNSPEKTRDLALKVGLEVKPSDAHGKIIMSLFEELVEDKLVQPTFVTHYPVEVSPLARKNDADPSVVDRFELYICGKEIANAFSELNDPEDQKNRFLAQMRERAFGDDEAHQMDDDYVEVLEYAMPPTAGEGIGIDRLVMLLTNSPSIRDVILFPLLRRKD